MSLPEITDLPIEGLKLIKLDLRTDERGWFTESWNFTKFSGLGIVNFLPVQANISFNKELGTTRGLHAEPWNKLVTVASGSAFCAWLDLRKGNTYLKQFSMEMEPGYSVFVPKGVANGFQTTAPNTTYSYLVDDHWAPDRTYWMVNPFDNELNIDWPFGLNEATASEKDLAHPTLSEVIIKLDLD